MLEPPFVWTTRVICSLNRLQLMQHVPLEGEPPDDFREFAVEVNADTGMRDPKGNGLMCKDVHAFNADSIAEAFEYVEKKLPELANDLAKRARAEVLKPKLAVGTVLNGENRMRIGP